MWGPTGLNFVFSIGAVSIPRMPVISVASGRVFRRLVLIFTICLNFCQVLKGQAYLLPRIYVFCHKNNGETFVYV